MPWEAWTAILGLTVIFSLFIYARWCEKSLWNKGICKENGLPWKIFDTDSQGGRGYRAGDKRIWISYRVDKVKMTKEELENIKGV